MSSTSNPTSYWAPPASAQEQDPAAHHIPAWAEVPYTPITLHPPPPPPTTDYSEAARLAAEEDRRRRNTVASARFRVKVKERGKALEVSLQEKQEKVKALEKNIERLETENRWLKELLVEKARIKRDT